MTWRRGRSNVHALLYEKALEQVHHTHTHHNKNTNPNIIISHELLCQHEALADTQIIMIILKHEMADDTACINDKKYLSYTVTNKLPCMSICHSLL